MINFEKLSDTEKIIENWRLRTKQTKWCMWRVIITFNFSLHLNYSLYTNVMDRFVIIISSDTGTIYKGVKVAVVS